jgi:hypothetical protein
MNTRRAALALISLCLMVSSAGAQQSTPAAPLNPQWCSGVPASPPPPNLEHHPGDWAVLRNRCMNNRSDLLCAPLCQDAKDRWKQQKAGLLNDPSSFPAIPANPAVPTSSPQWCTDAPASPPPPGFDRHPGDWANVRKMCAAHGDRGCMWLCELALELWRREKASKLNRGAQQPTPAALVNPNWCPQVPASPAPPYFDGHYGTWAEARKICTGPTNDSHTCGKFCVAAQDLWNMQKSGLLKGTDTRKPAMSDQAKGHMVEAPMGGSFSLPTPTPVVWKTE